MTDSRPLDERLLARILQAGSPRTGPLPVSEHVDEESLALFAEGGLTSHEREELLRHFDVCPDCRHTAALLLTDSPPVVQMQPMATHQRGRSIRVAWSVAAALLVAVTIFVLRPPKGADGVAARQTYDSAARLLATSDFDQVETVLATAKRRGAWSPALSSLEAQVIRRMPSPLALALAGRLTDFGYDVGGVVPRNLPDDPEGRLKSAQSVLADAGSDDVRVLLNRGHVLLSLREADKARREFEAAVKLGPNALAWLGLGLANFMLEDFAAAEQAFRQCLQIDGRQIAAKFNLALTLEEAGQPELALEVWKSLQSDELSAEDRAKVEQAIRLLEERGQ